MSTHDNYKKIDIPDGTHIEPCPVCASLAELWRFSDSPSSPTTTAVCCENGHAFGPQTGEIDAGCLLYMPPDEFYQGTIREAIKFWNAYAKALENQRRGRRWKTAKAMRKEFHNSPQNTCDAQNTALEPEDALHRAMLDDGIVVVTNRAGAQE